MKVVSIPIAFVVATVFFTAVGAAQPRFEGRGERRPNPPPRGEAFERILDEDQRAELREIFRENRQRLREIDEKIRTARRELEESIFSSEFDEAKAKKTIGLIAKLEGERQFLRAKAMAKIRPTLRPEQIERLKELRNHREEMARNFRPDLRPRREFAPEPQRRPARDEIAPPSPRDREFPEGPDYGRDRESRFYRDEPRRFDRGERFESRRYSPPPREREWSRREFDERRSWDFPDDRDSPLPPPPRGRPEPE
jgi:Spy/CpxP family protein refolding chaperone